MSSSKTTEFPLSNMPRMGRRNAVVYPSRLLDDDGAFSPLNLLSNDSQSDIDPDGIIAQELRFEKRSRSLRDKKSKGAVEAGPVISVLDGWKKLHDASKKSKYNNGIERLFETKRSFKSSSSTTEAKTKKNLAEDLLEKDQILEHPHAVIPWRTKQDTKQTTGPEERRKLFESFDKTSMEPPETPQVSDLTLRKSRKNKRKKNTKELKSQTSVPTTSEKNKSNKESKKVPYSNIHPKVNTRWNMGVEQDAKLKIEQVPESTEKENKPKRITGGGGAGEKVASTRAKSMAAKPLESLSDKKQLSNTDNHRKLLTNYTASETAKNTTDQLPLTIGPRFNHKKALGLAYDTPSTKSKTEDGDSNVSTSPGHGRLYDILPSHPKAKYEKQDHLAKPTGGNSLKSTFLNLQRINNAGVVNAGPLGKKRGSSTAHLVVSQYSANILGTQAIGLPDKKTVPIITTIQAPPLPFLASVQSQMNEISAMTKLPPKVSGTLKGNKSKKDPKSGKSQPTGKATNLKMKNKAAIESAKVQQAATAKVVPALGAVPNRYNNIYIGPYSGSESEGEHQGLKKKR